MVLYSINSFLNIPNFSYYSLSANVGHKIILEDHNKTLLLLKNFYKSHNDNLKSLIGDDIDFKIDNWNNI